MSKCLWHELKNGIEEFQTEIETVQILMLMQNGLNFWTFDMFSAKERCTDIINKAPCSAEYSWNNPTHINTYPTSHIQALETLSLADRLYGMVGMKATYHLQ